MISVVAVGFSLDELMKFPAVAWAHHDPSMAKDLSNREYMLMVERAMEQSDIAVVNLGKSLTPDEVVIIHIAYINRTPIIAVGLRQQNPLLEEMVSQWLPGLDIVVEHITANYNLIK